MLQQTRTIPIVFVIVADPVGSGFVESLPHPGGNATGFTIMEPIAAPVHDRSELESVVAEHAREPNSGLIVMPDGFMNVHRAEIVSLAARYRLPAVYPWRFFAELGGLLSYGSEQGDLCRSHSAG
jgi:putative ABC transport system substrate-binding protein